MVSVVGRTTAAAATDRDGRYALRELPYGPYILSVHSRGYFKSRGRTIQLTASKVSVPEIQIQLATRQENAGFRRGTGGGGDRRAGDPARRVWNWTRPQPSPRARGVRARKPPKQGETAWRLRHLPRSILKDAAAEAVWTAARQQEPRWFSRGSGAAFVPIAFFSDLPLSGQLNLMTMESFDQPGRNFCRARSAQCGVRLGQHTGRRRCVVDAGRDDAGRSGVVDRRGLLQVDRIRRTTPYELGLAYSTQRYDGGNAAALGAIRENARNVGSVYGYDEWTVSPRLVLGYGTGYARYDYLGGPGVWSPRVSITVPAPGFRLKALASQQSTCARRRRVRSVRHRHMAAARAHVLVAFARRAL